MEIKEGRKSINWLKSSARFAEDIIAPGTILLNHPIEGISTELRYHTRLWRVRLGTFAHGFWSIEAAMNQDYLLSAVNIGVIVVSAIMVNNSSDWKWRRIKRMYTPFLK